MKTKRGVCRALAVTGVSAALLGIGSVPRAEAQIGSGWSRQTYTKKIHLDDESGLQTFSWTASKSVCSPACADYRYTSSSDTETFRILDSRSNRSEIRLQNEYSSGQRQLQGYVTFSSPLNDESLFQIFGSTTGATLTMMRGYSASGGSIRVVGGDPSFPGGTGTIATSCYGRELRINVIHSQNQYVEFYVNGSRKARFQENERVSNYWKYGAYGTLRTGAVTVRWRQARTYSK